MRVFFKERNVELVKTATFYILSHTLKYILLFPPNISFCKISSLASNQLIVCESQIYISWPCQEQKWANYCSRASWLLLRMSVEHSKRMGKRKSVSSWSELLLLADFCTRPSLSSTLPRRWLLLCLLFRILSTCSSWSSQDAAFKEQHISI